MKNLLIIVMTLTLLSCNGQKEKNIVKKNKTLINTNKKIMKNFDIKEFKKYQKEVNGIM